MNDSSDNTLLNAIAGSEFENQIESFACLKFTESITVVSVLILESFIKNSIFGQKIFIASIITYGIIGCCICYTFPFKLKYGNEEKSKIVQELELSMSVLK